MAIAGTILAVLDPQHAPPRVQLTVAITAANQAEVDASDLSLRRRDVTGENVPVREADPIEWTPVDATHWTWTGHDYEARYFEPTAYVAWDNATGGQFAAITETGTLTLIPDPVQDWLIHPGSPTLSIPVDLADEGDTTRRSTRGEFLPFGRRRPIVVTAGARTDDAGTWVLNLSNHGEVRALQEITLDDAPLLLQIAPVADAEPYYEYLSIGDWSRSLKTGSRALPWYSATLPYVVVDRPAGPGQSARTYADVLAGHGTYGDVLATYDTYHDLLLGVSA